MVWTVYGLHFPTRATGPLGRSRNNAHSFSPKVLILSLAPSVLPMFPFPNDIGDSDSKFGEYLSCIFKVIYVAVKRYDMVRNRSRYLKLSVPSTAAFRYHFETYLEPPLSRLSYIKTSRTLSNTGDNIARVPIYNEIQWWTLQLTIFTSVSEALHLMCPHCVQLPAESH